MADTAAPAKSSLMRSRRPISEPRLTLLCFAHAGGGALTYRRWGDALAPRGIDVWSVQLPGHETRITEPVQRNLSRLIGDLTAEVTSVLGGRPYALFGHSVGAAIAYAYAHAMRRPPDALIVAASRPPHLPDPDAPIHRMDRDALLAKVISYGGVPEEILDVPEWVDGILDLVRADFELVETYPLPGLPSLDCPVVAFAAADDRHAPAEVVSQWCAVTQSRFVMHLVDGGHFWTPHTESAMWKVIGDALVG